MFFYHPFFIYVAYHNFYEFILWYVNIIITLLLDKNGTGEEELWNGEEKVKSVIHLNKYYPSTIS